LGNGRFNGCVRVFKPQAARPLITFMTGNLKSAGATSPAEGQNKSMLEGIQYLRAAGCLIVVLFHSRHYFSEAKWVAIDTGGISTLSFFVVSAFVLMYTTEHITRAGDWRAVGDFIGKRLTRIVPLYWLAVLIASSGYWIGWLSTSGSLKELYWNWNPMLSSFIKDLFFIPHPHAVGIPEQIGPLVIPAWTLNYEMLYYAIFALALFSGRLRVPLALALLGIACMASLLADRSVFLARAYNWKAFLEFGLGIGLYLLWNRFGLRQRTVSRGFSFIIAGALATSLGTWAHSRFGVATGAALLIWGCALLPGSRHWSLRFARKIGDASYSIYLFHTVVAFKLAFWCLDSFGNVRFRVDAGELGKGVILLAMGFVLVVSVTTGLAIYQWVEKPMVGWLLRKLPSSASSSQAIQSGIGCRSPSASQPRITR